MNVIIIHGAYGNPQENWIPWLKEQLEKSGHEVIVPSFPTPKGQSVENWMEVISTYDINENTILIGHSIACAFILSVVEKYKAKAAFFIAPWVGNLGNHLFDSINSSFMKKFDFENIKRNCSVFICFGSDNDPYVSVELEEKFAQNLGVELQMIKGAGHFNEVAGYRKFNELLKGVLCLK